MITNSLEHSLYLRSESVLAALVLSEVSGAAKGAMEQTLDCAWVMQVPMALA